MISLPGDIFQRARTLVDGDEPLATIHLSYVRHSDSPLGLGFLTKNYTKYIYWPKKKKKKKLK